MISKTTYLSIFILITLTSVVSASEIPNTVDSFEKIFGITKGKRRNHTKGFCFNATLTPLDSKINTLTNSPLFNEKSTVIGRLSHKGGNNNAADDKPAAYGMGLAITTASGERHHMSMNTLDFFPVATAEAFIKLMHAKSQGANAVKEFTNNNSYLQNFNTHMSRKKQSLTPYENSTFNSLNSFYLVNTGGKKTAVRWSFIPNRQQHIIVKPEKNFFFNNMKKNLNNHSITWSMVITIANHDDAINNAAIQWEKGHEKIVVAELKVLSISTEKQGNCDNLNFDPLILPSGIEPSKDPILQARRHAYAISFGRRMTEKQTK